ncbi:receptor-like protein 9b isoform X3 [Pistacia vera]|uniref:receptor-like protein 9b isoform X3 n=1 Tax=Pistacia vera TaxID=55513 RepID=UPI0012635EAB|nr:receptor-like protein 9b isoform X3 [Pistacia vera]
MDCKWFWVLLVIMLVSSGEGCWEEERTALLQLKPVFSSKNYLQDWVENSNCCEWERVVCDNITSRVMKLELYDVGDGKVGGWYLNASLFSSFQQLQSLDLSGNNIVGCIENEDLKELLLSEFEIEGGKRDRRLPKNAYKKA